MVDYNILVPSLENSGPTNMALEIAQQARKSGFDVYFFYLDESRDINTFAYSFKCEKLTLRKAMLVQGVLHTHGLRPDITGALIKIVNKKFVLINTIHNHFLPDLYFQYGKYKVKFAFKIWGLCLRSFDARFCISKTMRRYYRRHFPDLQFNLAYNFSSLKQKQNPDNNVLNWIHESQQKGRLVGIFVGALIPRKNIVELVHVAQKFRGISLLVCGDGPEKSRVIEKVADGPNVKYVGKVKSVTKLIAECDFLILPSFSEGFPMVILEAASLGKISLLSNIAVHREISEIGVGFVFDHSNLHRVEENISHILDDFFAKKTEGTSVKEIYDEILHPDIGFQRYENVIRSITGNGGQVSTS